MTLKETCRKLQYYPESVMVCLFFGVMMLSPIQEQYLYKVYSEKIGVPYGEHHQTCPSLNSTNNDTALFHQVQDEVSKFVTRQVFVMTVPPILGVLYFGPLSDRYGRKPFIITCVSGFLFLAVSLILIDAFSMNILFLHVGGFVCGMCGYLPCIVFTLMAYLADVSSPENLPFRIAVIDLISFTSLGVSNLLSGYVLDAFGFMGSFIFIAALVLVALLLSVLFLKESLDPEKRAEKTAHWITLPKKIYNILMLPRSQKWRLKLLIPTDALGGVFNQVVIGPILLLRLLNIPFCWSSVEIGMFRGTYFFTSGIGAVVAVKLIPMYFHKVFVILLSYVSSCVYLILLGAFDTTAWYYGAVVAGMFSYCALAMTRSLLATCVQKDERGSIFAFLGALQSVYSVGATFGYQALYRFADKRGKPGAVFTAMSFMTIPPFILAVWNIRGAIKLLRIYLFKDKTFLRKEEKRRSSYSDFDKQSLKTPTASDTEPIL